MPDRPLWVDFLPGKEERVALSCNDCRDDRHRTDLRNVGYEMCELTRLVTQQHLITLIIMKASSHIKSTNFAFHNFFFDRTSSSADTRKNKTCNAGIAQHWGAFVQPSLQQKNNKQYIFWVCICSSKCPACNEHAPYSSLACSATKYFSTLFHKRHDFFLGGGELLNKKCVFCLYNFRLTLFSFLEEMSKLWSKMHVGLGVKYPLLFLSGCNETGIFFIDFRKISKYHTL